MRRKRRRRSFFPSVRRRRRRAIAIGTRQLRGVRTIEQEKLFKRARAHARKAVNAQIDAMDKQKLQPSTLLMAQQDWDDIIKWVKP